MCRYWKELLLCIVMTFMISVSVTAAERQGPKIAVKESRFDFGMVEQGAQPEHVFEIVNTGDEVLEIRQVQPT